MQILSLALVNFRIYKEAFFEFDEQVNGIIGDNAVGKTTLLEAIHVAIFGRSFRTTELKDLIREGADQFRLEVSFLKNGIIQKICFFQGLKERRVLHNSTAFNQLSSLLGILQGVLIAPHDMDLIRGAPAIRRRFLDMQLSQIDPLYVHHFLRYNRAMKQRNFLLKSSNLSLIEPFEKAMAASAAYIVQQRMRCVQQLSDFSEPLYGSLSNSREVLQINYLADRQKMPNDLKELEDFYFSELHRLRARELIFGYTLVGPHKNDLSITINQKEARYFASEGQKNSVIAALKFAEWALIAQRTAQKPLMMIDDLSLSLDAFRQSELCKKIAEMGQCYFSTVSKPSFTFDRIKWITIN
ncbi:DNA replication and repair protein RecF [Chlamydiales bacterium STE3]|nr:DNA replication and repair protein RecF [Chlamydiales bacterium STE3]